MSAYSYDIKYKGTKLHASLSYLPVQGEEDQDAAATAMFKISVIEELPITTTDYAAETNKDNVLSQVYRFMLEGWPQRRVDDSLKPFYQRKDQLTHTVAYYGGPE